jgi:DNA-binding PadR family transcriptional regulator
MASSQHLPSQYLPLGEPAFYILLSLGDGEKHGYAILKDVQTISNGTRRLSVSTLYETLSRLMEQDMVERLDASDAPASPRMRKVYRLSRFGRQVLEAETMRMQRLVEQAQLRLARGES